MPTLGGITYTVMYDGSGGYSASNDTSGKQSDATMVYKVAHADVAAFADALLGHTAYVGGAVVITAPTAHPVYTNLYAYAVDSDPYSPKKVGATDFVGWLNAFVTVKYKPLEFTLSGGGADLEEEALEFSGQVDTIAKTSYGFSASHLVDRDIQKVVPLITYTVRKFRQPSLPLTAIFNAVGKLNSATFKGAAAETLLYAGCGAARRITTAGATEWQVEHKFLYNPNNHNKEWNGTVGSYEYVYSPPNLTTRKKYETVAFTTLGLSATGQGA